MSWTTVRVSADTKARLEALREQLLRGESQTKCGRFDPDGRDRVGLDQVIQVLLAREERHAERKRRSAARRRGAGREEVQSDPRQESGLVPDGV